VKSEYLDRLKEDSCNNEKEKILVVERALEWVLIEYQWDYQNGVDDQQQRDYLNGNVKSIEKVCELLIRKGDKSLADTVKESLYENFTIQIKSKILSDARKSLKSNCVCELISDSTYSNDYAKLMIEAFIDICTNSPIKEAPEYLNFDFDQEPCDRLKD